MTSSHSSSSHSDECGDEQQNNSQLNIQPQPSAGNIPLGMEPLATQLMIPHGQLEMDPNAVQAAAYPFVDPYYGGILAAYNDGKAVVHPYYAGVQPGLPLPSDAVEEPVYVNAKQYRGILRRRQSRAKAESENKLIKNRKPYLHESRHLHALKRARGCGGRFLTANDGNKKNSEPPPSSNDSPRQESEENTASAHNAQSSAGPSSNGSYLNNGTRAGDPDEGSHDTH